MDEPKKILIIEDEPQIRDSVAQILKLYDYETFTAEDGDIGIQKAVEHKPDIILCDVMMPKMDGFETLRLLRQNKETKFIPFIFLTARSNMDDLREGMNLGADDYLTKPFRSADLIDIIQSRIERRAQFTARFQSTIEELDREAKNSENKMDKFAYTTAHHIRGPLCRILGLVQMMRAEFDTAISHAELDKLLDVLYSSCEDLDEVIFLMMDSLKPQAG